MLLTKTVKKDGAESKERVERVRKRERERETR